GDAIINDGYYEYLVRRVNRAGIPKIPDPPKKENNYPKNLIRSTVFHTIVLFLGGLFFSLSSPPGPQPPESHFVQIDTHQLINTKKKIEPVPKKLKPRAVQKPTKKLKKKLKKSTYAKATPKKKRRIVRSPKAGRVSSKAHGNVLNRNIKEAGILSALGINKGIRLGVKDALAAVTNLDAVTSLHSNEGKLKVGGIVGKLDSSRIEVPSVGLVNTRGSTQVLRSAGIEGNGKIAALEKGKTGQKQVKAMVTADLNKRVRVQGGMSREAVKKVIDQHIDELSYCYETALITDSSLMGKMVFEWKILLTGRVGEIRIKSSSIKSNDIYSCIKAAIKSWQFPEPKGTGVVVSYPMIFDVVGF
ncbi:MAG: AgmX/PglI C-terminal domain-containing protein, partial [Nitrospinota bacterium]